jgi:serine-type D-Ala-D-Ala carboxypeptidase/endopeptidase (penicillin-binding protein 4)
MRTIILFVSSVLMIGIAKGQGVIKKLDEAVENLQDDNQMRNALLGFYVVESKTGETVYNKNKDIGFAVASSQKVITSAASFELLGSSYRYKTELAYDGKIDNGVLNGNVYLIGNGDPTLGSWRYDNTKEQVILNKWTKALQSNGIKKVNGNLIGYDKNWESQITPGGWIWDDIGNWYGAGASALNWRENQYDLKLKSGKTGDKVSIVTTVPKLYAITLLPELTAGKAGSGDNGYIYLPPYANVGFVRGTIPPNESSFTISGSFPNPAFQVASTFAEELNSKGVAIKTQTTAPNDISLKTELPKKLTSLSVHYSPTLDSITYYFLKRSLNLYGECLLKTLGYEKKNIGSRDSGLSVLKSFWKSNGIDPLSINVSDGSGLSPQNRVTPSALVKVMQYARSRTWFNSFYYALPEINGIKMKSGTIGGAKSFTGYVGGYTFAIVVNNYNGSASEIVRKLYKVLDVLK